MFNTDVAERECVPGCATGRVYREGIVPREEGVVLCAEVPPSLRRRREDSAQRSFLSSGKKKKTLRRDFSSSLNLEVRDLCAESSFFLTWRLETSAQSLSSLNLEVRDFCAEYPRFPYELFVKSVITARVRQGVYGRCVRQEGYSPVGTSGCV